MLSIQTNLPELERRERKADLEEYASSLKERTLSHANHGANPSTDGSTPSSGVDGYPDDADGRWFENREAVASIPVGCWVRGSQNFEVEFGVYHYRSSSKGLR